MRGDELLLGCPPQPTDDQTLANANANRSILLYRCRSEVAVYELFMNEAFEIGGYGNTNRVSSCPVQAVRPPASTVLSLRDKPKVLLADDHIPVLKSVSKLLASDFDVVAAVTDGRRAVDAAMRLAPDVVLLDVTMPELDGFQTVYELKRLGSGAKVVFLTMHEADDYVAAAITAGAQGYVVKSRLQKDLTSALNHVLADRLFVPSLTSLLAVAADGNGHAAQFYAEDRSIVSEAVGFIGTALKRGDVAVIVATDKIRSEIARRLQSGGWDVAAVTEQGRYIAWDAADALARIMRNGLPDVDLLAELVDAVERSRLAFTDRPNSRVTIFGELSVLLCRSGNAEGAIQLERLWNRLTSPLQFLTLCGYPVQCFQDTADPDLFSKVCAEHWAVSHAPVAVS
jgi:DNA-binding NarL/FixJ family response regulator